VYWDIHISQNELSARTDDVYAQYAADQEEARRERDRVITWGQEQHDGGLRVTETNVSAGRRMVTASAGGQVCYSARTLTNTHASQVYLTLCYFVW
jgi:hypothetical protein